MDKRNHPRNRSTELIKLIGIDPDTAAVTNIHDISKSGVSFYLDKDIKPSQKLTAIIHVPQTDQNIRVEVQVVRSRRQKNRTAYQVGAKFHELTEGDWARIQPTLIRPSNGSSPT